MKKTLAIAMLSSVATLGLYACGGSSDGNSSSSAQPSTFITRFNASTSTEPASVSATDAGAVMPDEEPHSV